MGSSTAASKHLAPVQEDRHLKLWRLPGPFPPLTAITMGKLTAERDGVAGLWMVDGMKRAPSTERIGTTRTFEDSLLLTNLYARVVPSDNLTRIIPGSVSCPGQWSIVTTETFLKLDLFSDSCIHGHVWHSAHTYPPLSGTTLLSSPALQ